ncbi:sulfotransferase family protein [Salinibacter ruber]|uniref:sulfotransferase family protein n=1 Tax=Salinibacter ruber TaxID=146919 RepID=UPI002168185C|nr:sulfotransferase [Salinibacter ruber]MCS4040861.1 hypothetical protein [Salinibacter ruber]
MVQTLESVVRSFDRRVAKGRLFLAYNGVLGERYRTIQRMAENPVFIGGSGRSGTTLFLSLLSTHPDIYSIPDETGAFCPTAYSEDEDLQAAFNIERAYSFLMDPDVPLERYSRWCEKSPKNILFAERLLNYFGERTRFINVVRDGRDVVTSKHPSDPDAYFVPPEEWVRDVAAGRRIEDDPRVITVRYEDLVQDHLQVLRRICEFLDEPFAEEAFRAYPDSSQIQKTRAWFGQAREISDESVGRWKEEEHEWIVNHFYEANGTRELLVHYDYL